MISFPANSGKEFAGMYNKVLSHKNLFAFRLRRDVGIAPYSAWYFAHFVGHDAHIVPHFVMKAV